MSEYVEPSKPEYQLGQVHGYVSVSCDGRKAGARSSIYQREYSRIWLFIVIATVIACVAAGLALAALSLALATYR